MPKPEPIPPEILRDLSNEIIELWQVFRDALGDSKSDDPDLVAALLVQAVVMRINGQYPMYWIPPSDPVASLKMPNWEKKP